jgi:hypothetical protein
MLPHRKGERRNAPRFNQKTKHYEIAKILDVRYQ